MIFLSFDSRITDVTIHIYKGRCNYIYIYIYIYICRSRNLSLSSCCAISTDILHSFSPSFSITHFFWQVFSYTSCIGTELLYVGSSWSFCLYYQCGGVHRSTSLMSSSILLQQCPACLVCLTLIVFVIGGKWPYSGCFVGCCLQDLFNIACSTLV